MGSRGQPAPSQPSKGRILPLQLISTFGHCSAKKITTAEMAMAAENAVVVILIGYERESQR